MQSLLAFRDDEVVPRFDGGRYDLQSYALAGQEVRVQLLPARGILYGEFGLYGALTTFVLPYDEDGNVLIDINNPEEEVPTGDGTVSGCAFGEWIRDYSRY